MCWLQLFTKYNYKLTKLLWTLVIYYKTKGLKLKTAQALFTPLRFCWYLFLWHLSYLFALRCFTKAKRKISGFVLSYLFAWLQNCSERDIRFCAFTFLRICQTHCLVLQCFLKSFFCEFTSSDVSITSFFVPFLCRFMPINVNTFTTMEVFLSVFV